MSYLGQLLGASYSCDVMQSVYSAALADWANSLYQSESEYIDWFSLAAAVALSKLANVGAAVDPPLTSGAVPLGSNPPPRG